MCSCTECSHKKETIYRPRRPEKTPLHKTIKKYYKSWSENKDDPVPAYIGKTFKSYLTCGILSNGFALGRCTGCEKEFLLGFSCKDRGVCPSCAQKDMLLASNHLVENVIPAVAIRQWVISFPKRIRYYLQNDNENKNINSVRKIVIDEIKQSVTRLTDLETDGQFGAISFIHRFGNQLNHHIHFHILGTDGLFYQNEKGELNFQESLITQEEIKKTEELIRIRLLKLFQRRKYFSKEEVERMLAFQHSGFSLDASVKIEGWDTEGLKRITKYCARGSFVSENLRLEKDWITYRLPKPSPNGLRQIHMSPEEFIERVSRFIPPPKKHLRHYHGAFGARSQLRPFIKALTKERSDPFLKLRKSTNKTMKASKDWRDLIQQVYESDPLICDVCGGTIKIMRFVTNSYVVKSILSRLGWKQEKPTFDDPDPYEPRRTFWQNDVFLNGGSEHKHYCDCDRPRSETAPDPPFIECFDSPHPEEYLGRVDQWRGNSKSRFYQPPPRTQHAVFPHYAPLLSSHQSLCDILAGETFSF